jgi:hypothetical protein
MSFVEVGITLGTKTRHIAGLRLQKKALRRLLFPNIQPTRFFKEHVSILYFSGTETSNSSNTHSV